MSAVGAMPQEPKETKSLAVHAPVSITLPFADLRLNVPAALIDFF